MMLKSEKLKNLGVLYMTKKFIAVILALVLSFSTALSVSAAAVEISDDNGLFSAVKDDANTVVNSAKRISELTASLAKDIEPYLMNVVLTSENIQKAFDIGSKAMIKILESLKPGTPDDPDKPDNPDKPDTPDDPDKPQTDFVEITIAELKKIMESYIFVKVDDVDSATLKVLTGVKYYPVELENGKTTVYIAVDIKNNPDIFNYDVFKKTVEKLYEKQGEALITDSDGNTDYLMSYEHIAGELALHAIIYAAANELISVTGTQNETILKLYERAIQADLNVDENRIPWQIFSIFGIILVDLMSLKIFSFLRSFSL